MNHPLDHIIQQAIEEDLPNNDITTDNLFTTEIGEAVLYANEEGIVSGVSLVRKLYNQMDSSIYFKVINDDGSSVDSGDIIGIIRGPIKSILRSKMLVLNFLRHMSGIATTVNDYVKILEKTPIKLLDTRATTPTLRLLEKRAVLDGGGINHCMNLSEQVIITPDHYHQYLTIHEAVARVKKKIDQNVIIEVQVTTYNDFLQAQETPCDMIMLYQMDVDTIEKCVSAHRADQALEVRISSGIERLRQLSTLDIPFISIEDLMYKRSWMDIEMKLTK